MAKTTTKKATSKSSDNDLQQALFSDLFTANKSGIREGFRRLAVLLGGLAFVYAFAIGWQLREYGQEYGVNSGLLFTLVVAMSSFVCFYVADIVTRIIGWVLEGFFG